MLFLRCDRGSLPTEGGLCPLPWNLHEFLMMVEVMSCDFQGPVVKVMLFSETLGPGTQPPCSPWGGHVGTNRGT